MHQLYTGGDIQKPWAKYPMKLGMGYADELHHEFKKPEHLLKVKVIDKDDIWLADFREMREENKFRYILTVICIRNVHGPFLYQNKKAQTVSYAFKRNMNESSRKFNKVWEDKGKEFYNQHVKALLFEIYLDTKIMKNPWL